MAGKFFDRIKQILSAQKEADARAELDASNGATPREGIGKSVLAGIVGSLVFLFLLLVLHWAFPIALLIGAGLTVALQFMTRSVDRIGTTPVYKIQNGQEALRVFRETRKNLDEMRQLQYRITDGALFKKIDSLVRVGMDIFFYLTGHPDKILPSEHFLEYYLSTANRILKNYVEMQNAHISDDTFSAIRTKTFTAIEYLQTLFTNQRDGYHLDAIQDLEEESDLLEETIEMGGGRI